MDPRTVLIAGMLLAAPSSVLAGDALSDMHPEEAYPNSAPLLTSPGPYAEVIKQVQEKLHALDFDAGEVDGAMSSKLQAALAQFQLSRAMPVNGMLDEETLKALGVDNPVAADATPVEAEPSSSAGGSAEPQ